MADLVGPILGVIKLISRPINSFLNCFINYHEYLSNCQKARQNLSDKLQEIENHLHEQLRFGKLPSVQVERWLHEVRENLVLAGDIEGVGLCNKWKYVSRYRLAKRVDKMTQVIKELHEKGKFSDGLVVNDPTALDRLEFPTARLVGSVTTADEIINYLKRDEVSKIGVWGMRGIGKTTIVLNVCNWLIRGNYYLVDKIICITVTQDFDILSLQKRIASQLQEDLSSEDDKIIREKKISAMLRRRRRYLLILDDVWKDFSLEDIGIPEPDQDHECKLIITTQDEHVVRTMGCKQVQVMPLSEQESLQLFLSKVGQDLLPNPTIKSTMELIVKECSGHPLAIVTVASRMRGITDPLKWNDALRELQSSDLPFSDFGKCFGTTVTRVC